MVNILRRFQQPVLITLTVLVIIAFVILYGGPGTRLDRLGSQHVATIYGRKVQPAEYTSIGRMFEICRTLGMLDLVIPLAQNARTMGEVTENYIWNTMVLRHEAKELGIEPTEGQVAEAIQKMSLFQTAGQYDHDRYQQALQMIFSPRGMNASHLEELVRDQIRLQTIRDLLSSNAMPAPDEIEAAYTQRYQKVEAAFIRIEKEAVSKTVQISEDDVKKAYEARKDNLKSPEKRKVQHVFFALPAKEKDGPAPTAEEMQKIADKSADFAVAVLAPDAKFDEVAKQFGVEVKTSPLFGMGERIADFSEQPRITAAAFQLSAEKPNSDPIPSEKGYFVLHLQETAAARPLTFEEAKTQLTDSLKGDRVRETLSLKAAEARKQIEEAVKGGKTFVQAAEAAGYKAETPEPFSRAESKLTGPEASQIQGAVADLKPGQTSQPLEGPVSTVLVHLIARQPVDPADLAAKKSELVPSLRSERSDGLLFGWVERQRSAAGLEFAQQEGRQR